MQSLPIYLYPNTLDVILDLDPDVLGVNRVMYQRDLKIQKGVKNKVNIQFKNSDQKRLLISNTSTYVFNMFDPASNTLILQKQIQILDDTVVLQPTQDQTSTNNTLLISTTTTGISIAQTVSGFGIPPNTVITAYDNTSGTITLNNSTTIAVTSATSLTFNTLSLRGIGQLTFLENDTVNLTRGSYQYSVTYRNPTDGTFEVAYANTYYDIAGTIYLNDQVYPQLQPSQEISAFLRNYNDATLSYEWKSGNIYAYPEYDSPTALHTMALYMGANGPFIGTVYIKGTLSNQPNGSSYSIIKTLTYTGFTGIDYVNFNGLFTYVSVMYVPAAAPNAGHNNNDPSYYGSFDKVLYRS